MSGAFSLVLDLDVGGALPRVAHPQRSAARVSALGGLIRVGQVWPVWDYLSKLI
jgi:hypothetical protein